MFSLSIVVPARNEEKYIEIIVRRVLTTSFPCEYELIFVEGHSKDKTLTEIKRVVEEYKNRMNIRYLVQDGIGKADAIWKGFNEANNDLLAILDSDLAVGPEEIPALYQMAASDPNMFVNGSRLVYKMEKGAMRPLNYLGNKLFAILLSFITKCKFTDTLCGTKVIYKNHFMTIKNSSIIEKLNDPFCDFTLLLGAHKLGLRIVEVPIHYKRRIYDTTKIRRFKDGWKLLKIVFKSFQIPNIHV